MPDRQAAAAIAGALSRLGSTALYGVPGGGNNLDVVGAAEAVGMRFVLAHGETEAAIMAATHSEVTGVPTGCVVTRGPGAMSAVNGVAHAYLERQPLVLIADAVPAAAAHSTPHQLIDQQSVFAPITKRIKVVSSDTTVQDVVRAVSDALTGRPGPVYLEIDPGAESRDPSIGSQSSRSSAEAGASTMPPAALDLLRGSTHPVLLLGMGSRPVARELRATLQGTTTPVLPTYRAKGVVPDSWPNVAGVLTGAPAEAALLAEADLFLAVGLDAVELLPGDWSYEAPIVSLGSWAAGDAYLPEQLEIVGDLARLVPLAFGAMKSSWPTSIGQKLRTATSTAISITPLAQRDHLHPHQVIEAIRAAQRPGDIITVDAGAHMLPAMASLESFEPNDVIISSGLATMGHALPAAIGAAVASGATVFCLTGDGGLGMALAELETVTRLGLPITIVVFNDSALSLIEVKQQSAGHGGASAVRYGPIDFGAIARAAGVEGHSISNQLELNELLSRSRADRTPRLLDVAVDPTSYGTVMRVLRGVEGAIKWADSAGLSHRKREQAHRGASSQRKDTDGAA